METEGISCVYSIYAHIQKYVCVSFHSVHYLCVVYVYVYVEDIYNVYIDVSI